MPTDPLPGFGTKGTMNDLAHGIIFGLVYAGVTGKVVAQVGKCHRSTVSRIERSVMDRLVEAEKALPSPEKMGPTRTEDPQSDDEQQVAALSDNDEEDFSAPPANLDPATAAVWRDMYRGESDGSWVHRSSRDIRKALAEEDGLVFSVRTIQRRVQFLGGQWVKRRVTAPLNEQRLKQLGLKQLVFIRENVNADNYTKLLERELLDAQSTDFKLANRV